jgi:hypothetical protein
MRLIALDNFDNRREGESFECSDKQGRALINKGLAKEGPKPLNKMAPTSDNKLNPTETAGSATPSSASPAGPVSGQTTAQPYPGGGLVTPDPRFKEGEKSAAEKPKPAPKRKNPAAKSSS